MLLPQIIFLAVCMTVHSSPLQTSKKTEDLSTYEFQTRNIAIEVLISRYVQHSDWESWYTEKEIRPVLQHIYEKFTNLMTPVFRPRHWRHSSRVLIPSAVARHNLEMKSSRDPRPYFTLALEFARHIYDQELQNGTSLDVVLHYAGVANDIMEGTVSTLMLQYGGLREDPGRSPQDALKETLESAAKIKASKKHKYQFGAMFHTADCDLDVVKRDLAPIMSHLDHIFFDKWPEQRHFDKGVEASLPEYLGEFDKCLQNVKKVNPEIKVGFRTRWDDTSPAGVTDVEAKRKFWVEVAKWAVDRDTRVVFHGAWDSPVKAERKKS